MYDEERSPLGGVSPAAAVTALSSVRKNRQAITCSISTAVRQ